MLDHLCVCSMQQIVGTMNGSPMAAASMFSSTPQSAVPVAQVEQPAPVPQPVAPMGPAPQPAMDVQVFDTRPNTCPYRE